MMFQDCYRGKKVWLSGHTGFKGAWLAEWLGLLGAEVVGFSLPPEDPSLYTQIHKSPCSAIEIGDLRDQARVVESILAAQPDFVFHLAAQPLVRLSYEIPVETYATNVMGTIHVLDALRSLQKECVAVMVTTDKCYENREWLHGYREEDPMGGHDPYSSSKGMAELAISAYRRSFFSKHSVRIASARAGNVIGGGDWAKDRLVPDCVRALQQKRSIEVRNKISTRPWQHVLEPLSGYLTLGWALSQGDHPRTNLLTSGFNFGPRIDSNRTVAELVQEVLRHWSGEWIDRSDPDAVHEAGLLNLTTDKAYHLLGWSPVWDFADSVRLTMEWYREMQGEPDGSPKGVSLLQRQIGQYATQAHKLGLSWSK